MTEKERTIRVRSGDCLSRIAEREMGRGDAERVTRFANPRERRAVERQLQAMRQPAAPKEEIGWGLDGKEEKVVEVRPPGRDSDLVDAILLHKWMEFRSYSLDRFKEYFYSYPKPVEKAKFWFEEASDFPIWLGMDWGREITFSMFDDPAEWKISGVWPPIEPKKLIDWESEKPSSPLPIARAWEQEKSPPIALASFTQPHYTKLNKRSINK